MKTGWGLQTFYGREDFEEINEEGLNQIMGDVHDEVRVRFANSSSFIHKPKT